MNIGLLFGREIHWFASCSLNNVLTLGRFRSGAESSQCVLRQETSAVFFSA